MSYNPKSYRKFLATSVAAAMVATVAAPLAPTNVEAAEAKFTDVDASLYYAEAVNKMAEAGFINGVGGDKFGTNQELLRRDAAVLFSRVLLWDTADAGNTEFTDVETGKYYSDAIAAAVANGVIIGKTATTFAPTDKLTRGEMAVLLTRALDLTVDSSEAVSLTDIEGHAYENEIKAVYQAGLTAGFPDGSFKPGATVTRADFATFLYRDTTVQANAAAVINAGVEAVKAINDKIIEVTFDNGDVVEVALDEALVDGENEVTFEVDGVEYTATVMFEAVVLNSGIAGFINADTAALEGATVTVDGKSVTTNEQGFYQLLDVSPGAHTVTIEADGYETVTVEDQEIVENEVSTFIRDIGTQLINTDNIVVTGVVIDGGTGANIVDGSQVKLEIFNEENDAWEVVATVATADGKYILDQDSATPDLELATVYRQTVSSVGYKDFVQEITLDSQEVINALAGIQLEEIEAIDINGTVTDSAGSVVDGADVTISDADGDVVELTTTDVDGNYSVSDKQLLSGTYNVVVDDGSSAKSYTEFTVVEGTNVTHDVQLEAGFAVSATVGTESLSDTFGKSGTDAETSVYTLELLNGNTVIDTDTFTGTVGADDLTLNFSLDRVAPGEYTIRVSGDYVVTKELDLTVADNESIEVRANPAGTLSGDVVDSLAAPIADVKVSLLNASGEVVEEVDSADGSYEFTGLTADDYTVKASAEDFVDGELDEDVTVAKNENTNAASIVLEEVETEGTASGFVRKQGNLEAVEGATVTFYNSDDEEVEVATVNSAGLYTTGSMDAGNYQVIVRGDGVETYATTAKIEAGQDLTNVNYTLVVGGDASLKITAIDSEGNSVDFDTDGIVVTDWFTVEGGTEGTWTPATSGDTVTIENLSGGTYHLDIDFASADYASAKTTATVATGEELELEITVVKVADQNNVNFLVVDETNTNVSDATVVVFDEDGKIEDVLSTVDGTVADYKLVNGSYTLAVYKNGYIVAVRNVTVNGDVTVPVIQLSLIK